MGGLGQARHEPRSLEYSSRNVECHGPLTPRDLLL